MLKIDNCLREYGVGMTIICTTVTTADRTAPSLRRRGVAHLEVSGKGGKTRYIPLHPSASGLILDTCDTVPITPVPSSRPPVITVLAT